VEAFAKNYPDRIFTICCNPGSPLAGMTQPVLLLPKGFEQTLAQTSSFSAMLLASLMVGAVVGDDDRTFAELQNAPAICDRIIQQAEPLVEKIMNHKAYQNTFFFGAGPTIGIAHDAQLKMMEMSLSDAMFFTFLESRHGPRSLITEDTLLVGFCTRSGHGLEAKLLNEYTKLHGATTVAITPNQDWDAGTPTFTIPVGCDWPDAILGLAYSPIMQLMAYYRAIHKGVNPDTSRNLTQHIAIDSVAK
jgi:glucosamine--fructose-6-phosphate aminotransferase (isomerizing)